MQTPKSNRSNNLQRAQTIVLPQQGHKFLYDGALVLLVGAEYTGHAFWQSSDQGALEERRIAVLTITFQFSIIYKSTQ